VGVPSEMQRENGLYVLRVDPLWHEQALAHLQRYQEESRRVRPPPPPATAPLYPYAWVGCVLFAAVLLGTAYAVSAGFLRLDAFDAGDVEASRVQAGQWWRAWTALTLHLDLAHLITNLGAGVWFGYLCGRLLGVGTAWLLIVAGAGIANLLEALLSPPSYASAGASTAVFTALGLLAVHSWQERRRYRQHWAVRVSPLVAGLVMLGWTGTAGEHTDIVAHLAGFAMGGALALLLRLEPAARGLRGLPQWLSGALALGWVALAWTLALHS
jgi:rhomboid protease GluP